MTDRRDDTRSPHLCGFGLGIGGYKPVHIDAAGEAAYEAARQARTRVFKLSVAIILC